ncbi:MAG: carboxypeptidase regulatory-like domain-containing protein [Gemmatimonadetes bacterium]|nr:carboxypeptidase regulatory-like domain-containing protein [Gemmatimonadota bacterium]
MRLSRHRVSRLITRRAWWGLITALLVVAAPASGQSATVSGVVRDTVGLFIAGAEVTVDGGSARAVSGEDGSYVLHGLTAGNLRLRIRRLGFRPAVMDVEVPTTGLVDVEIQLVQVVTRLAAVSVLARRDAFESRLAGFYERRDRKVGHFVSRDRIERTHSFSFTDLLREIPG